MGATYKDPWPEDNEGWGSDGSRADRAPGGDSGGDLGDGSTTGLVVLALVLGA